MSAAKIAILMGGPDWPTSVLCGIMKLDLIPNLIGTLPILIMIVPMVLVGTSTYLASLPPKKGVIEFPWAGTTCTIFVVLSAFVQFCEYAASSISIPPDRRIEAAAALNVRSFSAPANAKPR